MSEIDRRRFLRLLAVVLGSSASSIVLGCQNRDKLAEKEGYSEKLPLPTTASSPIPSEEPGSTPAGSAEELTPTAEPTAAPALPELAVARHGEPEVLTRTAVAAIGGMERFVNPGDRVIIKPNICVAYHSYEYAATTNPWVVGALVKMALEAGAKKVSVMDYPFGGSAEQAYKVSGIAAEVQKAGGKMVTMAGFQYQNTEIPQGRDLKQCKIYQEVLDADVLVNVPIAKHHGLARLTLAMKNMMGVIYNRPLMHANLGQRLADLNSRVRSHLVVVDAVRMLMDHGPSGGNLADVKKADTVIATPDIVAADAYAASLFGLRPRDLDYIQAGFEMGLGNKRIDQMKIEEISLG